LYFHFSEEPGIKEFVPRKSETFPDHPPIVWAIDEWHAPLYFFPRDCPRIAFWRSPDSSCEDIERFLSASTAKMVIAVESGWLSSIKNTQLYRYLFAPETFTCFDDNAGYYTSLEKVIPVSVEPVGDLLECLANANVEMRFMPSLHLLQDVIAKSSLSFSMIRMRNANLRKNV
jgi:hypothetical protein